MSRSAKLLLLQFLIVLPVCSFLFFFGLGAFGLVGADEPRYAQIGREMLARHDWIVPTINGQPWLEKPVLLYWQEMVAYSVFGVHDWAARIPSAIFAAGLVIAILFFMRRFRPGSELDAALITASCAAVIGFGRGASTDMQLSAPLSAAMLAWWGWHESGRKLWLGFFYALLAVGALAKGPVSPALAVLIVAAYAALRHDGRIFVRSLWIPGFILFFAIALPWYVAVQVKVPQFFRVFFLQHNLERFGTNMYQHSQPFWYYVPVFIVSVLPWSIFTVPAVWNALRQRWNVIRSRGDGNTADDSAQDPEWLDQFLMLWILVPVVFFSVSRSKLPGYILPAIPPAALLTAGYLQVQGKIHRIKLILHSVVCGAVLAGGLIAPWLMLKRHLTQDTWTSVIAVTCITASAVLLLVRYRGARVLHFVTLVPVVLALVFLLRFAAAPPQPNNPVRDNLIDLTQSSRSVDAALRTFGVNSGPIAIFNVPHQRELEYGLNFYRNQPIQLYGRDPISEETHVVIAKQGDLDAVQSSVGNRKVVSVGGFAFQRLEFFKVLQ